jgi:hypothetical protein
MYILCFCLILNQPKNIDLFIHFLDVQILALSMAFRLEMYIFTLRKLYQDFPERANINFLLSSV